MKALGERSQSLPNWWSRWETSIPGSVIQGNISRESDSSKCPMGEVWGVPDAFDEPNPQNQKPPAQG